MMQASVYGRLGNDPRQHETKSGKPMASCSIAIDVTGNSENPETLWLKILTFNKTAEQLLRHAKGDLISLSGRIIQNRWVKNGEEKVNLQIIADTVISARTVRPGGVRKKQEQPVNQSVNQHDDFNDDLEF